MTEYFDIIVLLTSVLAVIISFVSLYRTKRVNDKLLILEGESLKINKDNEQRVYREKLLELDNIITRSRIFQSKFDREVEKMKRVTSGVSPHVWKEKDAESFLKKLDGINELRKKTLEWQTKGTEVSEKCWAMERIDVRLFKKLQEVCSGLSEIFNLLEHEVVPLENVFTELSNTIEAHEKRAHLYNQKQK